MSLVLVLDIWDTDIINVMSVLSSLSADTCVTSGLFRLVFLLTSELGSVFLPFCLHGNFWLGAIPCDFCSGCSGDLCMSINLLELTYS